MRRLILPKGVKNETAINRTIRFDGDLFDALTELTEDTGLTFNRLVNICLRFAIENTELAGDQDD